MEQTATEILGPLDANGTLSPLIRRLAKGTGRDAIRSREEFDEAYRALIVTRIIEANGRNEYSRKLDGVCDNMRAETKSLFLRLIRFADDQPDPVCQKDLFLLLCYVKPESPQFVSRVGELRAYIEGTPSPVSAAFINYVVSTLPGVGANVPGLSPIEHFRNTRVVTLAGEQMQCRVAHSSGQGKLRVYCGCSSADCLLFDTLKNEFDIYLTLPGLSLRHLTTEFLTAIYDSIIVRLTPAAGKPLHITICVGFIDRLKVIGALDEWDGVHLESVVERAISNALACIRRVNKMGHGLFEFTLYPGCFPVRNVDKVTVNGVVPFHGRNAETGGVVEQLLNATDHHEGSYFPRDAVVTEGALIHDREIHPKLGADLSGITQRA